MSRRRVTVYDNRSPGDAKLLSLPDNSTLQEFLYLSGQKLNMIAVKAFLSDGGEIDDAHLIRDNDIIFVSAGEPFQRHILANRTSAVSITSTSTNSSNSNLNTNNNNGNNNNNNKDPSTVSQKSTYSIAVMGAGSVGKSAVTLRYVQGIFVKDYDPTIEDAYRKSVIIDGEASTLDILDTAGQEDYIALRSTWMRERDGFVLVFSLIDKSSFEALNGFYEQLISMHEDGLPPVILVGNKADLENKRVISTVEGQKRAQEYNNAIYLESSAFTGEGVDKIFTTLVGKIRNVNGFVSTQEKKKKSWCSIL